MMRRYLLFGGSRHYPEGGWEDFIHDFAEEREAVMAAVALVSWTDEYMGWGEGRLVHYVDVEWWQIADTELRTIVASGTTNRG